MPIREVFGLDYHPFATQYDDPDYEAPPQPKTFVDKWGRRQSGNIEDRRRGPLTPEEDRAARIAQFGTGALALPATAANILNPFRNGTPSEEFDGAQEQVGTPMYADLTGDDPRRVAELMARRRYERTPRFTQDQLWRAAPAPLDNQPPAPRNVVTAQPVRITQSELRPTLSLQPQRAGGMGRGTIREVPDGTDPFAPMENPQVGNTTPVVRSGPGQVQRPLPVGGDPMMRNARTREQIDQLQRRGRGNWLPNGGNPEARSTWDASRQGRVAAARSGIRPPPQPQQQAMNVPPVGTVYQGWRYLGGDPHDRNSWGR